VSAPAGNRSGIAVTATQRPKRWSLRRVPPELERRYVDSGWWTGETLGGLVEQSLRAHAKAGVSIWSRTRPWHGCYADIDREARQLVALLQASGVEPGEVVAFQFPNCREALVAFAALALGGTVLIPIVHIDGRKQFAFTLEECGATARRNPEPDPVRHRPPPDRPLGPRARARKPGPSGDRRRNRSAGLPRGPDRPPGIHACARRAHGTGRPRWRPGSARARGSRSRNRHADHRRQRLDRAPFDDGIVSGRPGRSPPPHGWPADGRRGDTRGDENPSAAEVEPALATLAGVAEIAVVAAPDSRLGEHACAMIRLAASAAPLALADLQRHLAAAGIARQKWPEEVRLVADFPRTASGKIRKVDLRAWLRAGAPEERKW
jgi:hypothetical protein